MHIIRIIPAILLLSSLSSCYMVRAYKFRNLNLSSHKEMPSLPVAKGGKNFLFAEPTQPDTAFRRKLDEQLKGTGTAAFILIRNDTMLYENYFDQYERTTLLPSFSVAKSFVATLVGMALEEGKIKSLDEPFTNYLPKFLKKDKRYGNITIQHLLDMRSGLEWKEGSYGLKDDAIKLAFRPNMKPYTYKVKILSAPGTFDYQSINTLLLAMVLEKATGTPPADYLREKIWKPLGMEYAATWNTDQKKQIIGYAGINATARDYAKFGRLYLNKGSWNGKELISEKWIAASVSPDAMFKKRGYSNQFWGTSRYTEFKDSAEAVKAAPDIAYSSGGIRSYTNGNQEKRFFIPHTGTAYYALGILGQQIYINPENNTIIVRLGYDWKHPRYRLQQFAEALSREL